MSALLIKNVAALAPGGIVSDVFIAAEGGVFTHIGSAPPEGDFEIIDGGGCLAIPGLVNAHTHCAMTLLRGYADGMPLKEWLFEKIFPVEARMSGEDVYRGAMLGIAEMIASGVTAFADMYDYMDSVAKAVIESGIRANLARGLMCGEERGDFKNERKILESISLYKEFHNAGGGRIKIYFGPHSVYTCTPGYIRAVSEVAGALGAGVHIHLSETAGENEECINKYRKTPTELLCELGLFKNPTLAAHCVHLSDSDIEILAKSGACAVYNPSSNLKLLSGQARVKEMAAAGVCLALGTDGAASNNNLNMVEEMHIAALLSGADKGEILKMGANAAALGFEGGGLEPGKAADFALIDMSAPHFYPPHDAKANLIYSAQAADVRATIVGGRLLYYKNEYKTIDIEKIIFDAKKSVKRLFG